ncbi:tRNA pseudouridine(13) synthase TruD [Marinobacter sp. CHS3-4]|uniref:tRNA pseudouridine(13) synthase TruD n=1 Tax=Marinobacter sp. CHS3-4 TaxID=3045174 RepID=UPI0024B52DDD|nr:tRNA pseudouridine(13) synthase TruD [Marinobacter sp. CHS3-4]MDI9246831.1 tRNA pseudouridine(13) synthase TruD [Marinobacter sp. CHS3-4]
MTSDWRLDWPTSKGRRVGRGILKACPADFRVDEILDVSDCKGGEHLYLRLEKTGDNTEYVARQLAHLAECRPLDVSFCGLKDRHAVTRQWFSLYRPGLEDGDEALKASIDERWPVLESCRAARKLRRSDHSGNRFEIIISGLAGQRDSIDSALEILRESGSPNYFGPQRFGHDGGNLDQAIRMDTSSLISGRGGKGKKRGRGRGSTGGRDAKNVLYFSAARSWLFNEVLAHRVETGTWREILNGEPGLPESPSPVATGPLWGDGGTEASDELGVLERQVVSRHPEVESVFSLTRMKPERRQLVMMPDQLKWHWLDNERLHVNFGLQPGHYATTLLSDVFDLEVSGGNRANSLVQ